VEARNVRSKELPHRAVEVREGDLDLDVVASLCVRPTVATEAARESLARLLHTFRMPCVGTRRGARAAALGATAYSVAETTSPSLLRVSVGPSTLIAMAVPIGSPKKTSLSAAS
jgi:hypothetical protein